MHLRSGVCAAERHALREPGSTSAGDLKLRDKLEAMNNTLSNSVVVGAAIFDHASRPTKMLAARRKAPKSLAGYWEFPGGKVEAGESHTGGLLREIQEELGVDVEILELVQAPDETGWPLDNGMRLHVFTAVVTSGEPLPLVEHDKLEWTALNADDMHALDWIPADRPIVDAILAKVAGHTTTV